MLLHVLNLVAEVSAWSPYKVKHKLKVQWPSPKKGTSSFKFCLYFLFFINLVKPNFVWKSTFVSFAKLFSNWRSAIIDLSKRRFS